MVIKHRFLKFFVHGLNACSLREGKNSSSARKVVTIICEDINEMEYIMTNIMLNLSYDELQEVREVREVECLKVTLVKDEVVYHGSVRDVSPFINVLGPFTS
ncbi:hypothetical protein IMY05_009G0019600 [Salix suchowensis]|nr:hypothetical protein IMY05_009G0019600 [Salix suchowensis]